MEHFDVNVDGPGTRIGNVVVPPGHLGITFGFGAETLDGTGRMETMTILKPAGEVLAFLDRLRTNVISELRKI